MCRKVLFIQVDGRIKIVPLEFKNTPQIDLDLITTVDSLELAMQDAVEKYGPTIEMVVY